eukprot:3190616-Alexandrium_andersonii.AAC.1
MLGWGTAAHRSESFLFVRKGGSSKRQHAGAITPAWRRRRSRRKGCPNETMIHFVAPGPGAPRMRDPAINLVIL